MRRIRIIHKIRTFAAITALLAAVVGGGMLWWANQTGLPDGWRAEIEKALASQGLHADIAGLRYWPTRGVQADEVIVYADESRRQVVAQVRQVVVDVDRTKLARGEVRVERLDLKGGSLTLPADPDDPESKVLEVSQVSGRLLMPGGRRMEVRNARGTANGIRLEFEALLLGYSQQPGAPEAENEESRNYRRRQLARTLDLLAPWEFDPDAPPVLRTRIEGDLEDPKSVRADISLRTGEMRRGEVKISKLEAQGEIRGRLLVLESLRIEDHGGNLNGRMEYDLEDREGRFEVDSNLSLPVVLREFEAADWLNRVTFESRPKVSATGTLRWPEGEGPAVHLTGRLVAENVRYQGHTADKIETDISWNGKGLFLDHLILTRKDGTTRGRLLALPDLVRFEVSTDLRKGVWRGLLGDHPVGHVLDDFTDRGDTEVFARVRGRFNPREPHDWSANGEARGTHMAYKGTPFRQARVKMQLSHDCLDFTEGQVEFDYTDYPLRKAHGGSMTGKAKVDRVRYDREPSTLTLEGIEGTFWPAPILRCFLPGVADHLEEYRFHQPPRLTGGGVIGLMTQGAAKTDFQVSGSTEAPLTYHFAGADLTLLGLKTRVQVRPKSTEIRDLSFGLFDGTVRGKCEVIPARNETVVKGELDWTRLSLPALSAAYGFENKAKGFVTGRMDFEHRGNGAAGLGGDGLIALEEGELFSVPIFGPLSPVLSTVLANRKVGFQDAKDAFCTFTVKSGVMTTDDFLTTTSSLVFTGDARADLNKSELEMTIRMNARGLLGVLTLPLKPFYGLFQFRGTGPLKEPQWKNVMFTSPPESENERLLAPPRARAIRGGDTP